MCGDPSLARLEPIPTVRNSTRGQAHACLFVIAHYSSQGRNRARRTVGFELEGFARRQVLRLPQSGRFGMRG